MRLMRVIAVLAYALLLLLQKLLLQNRLVLSLELARILVLVGLCVQSQLIHHVLVKVGLERGRNNRLFSVTVIAGVAIAEKNDRVNLVQVVISAAHVRIVVCVWVAHRSCGSTRRTDQLGRVLPIELVVMGLAVERLVAVTERYEALELQAERVGETHHLLGVDGEGARLGARRRRRRRPPLD